MIISGQKDIEMRSYRPPKNLLTGTKMILHTGMMYDKNYPLEYPNKKLNFGCALGTMEFVGFNWYESQYSFRFDYTRHYNPAEYYVPITHCDGRKRGSCGWVFKDVKPFSTPVMMKGQLGVFYKKRKLFPELI